MTFGAESSRSRAVIPPTPARTHHRGLNSFQDGDKVELEIAGLGRLAISVSDPLQRTWGRDTRLEHAEKGLPGPFTPQLTGKYADT